MGCFSVCINILVVALAVLFALPALKMYSTGKQHSLEGKCAVVTGASAGIGVIIADELAANGVTKLVLAARSMDKLEAVVATLQNDHPSIEAIAVQTDVADPNSRRKLHARATDFFGDTCSVILVNNAGVERWKAFTRMTEEEIDLTLDVNLRGLIYMTKLFLPNMLEQDSGHVVNIASLAGKVGGPFSQIYAASKFGVVGFTASLRREMDLLRSSVTHHVICPGFITEAGMAADGMSNIPHYDDVLQQSGSSTPRDSAKAVVRAIEYNEGEILVNSIPMQPLLALQELFPPLFEWIPLPEWQREFWTAIANRY